MEDKYKIPFIHACIRGMRRRFNLPAKNAYQYLKHFKGIDFLLQFYNTLPLQSIEDTVDDLIIVCKKNGGALAWYSIIEQTLISTKSISARRRNTRISDKDFTLRTSNPKQKNLQKREGWYLAEPQLSKNMSSIKIFSLLQKSTCLILTVRVQNGLNSSTSFAISSVFYKFAKKF